MAKRKKHSVGEDQAVNGYDACAARQREKLIDLLNEEKNKRKLSNYQVSVVYPLSNFVTNNVKTHNHNLGANPKIG